MHGQGWHLVRGNVFDECEIRSGHMWRTMVQQSLDHVTVTIFDSSDERGHTVLVFGSDG
jgi:hypothetical protein